MFLQSCTITSPFQILTTSPTISKRYFKSLNASTDFLGVTLFHNLGRGPCLRRNRSRNTKLTSIVTRVNASFLEAPALWAGKMCIFYALMKFGLAGSEENTIVSGSETGVSDLGFSKEVHGKPERELANKTKLVSKWHPTTKGTLKRNYRIPSKSEGRRLLKSIAALLSDDDHFRDASTHKGCQIRRESAHGESLCCNNVRALFDELPTPQLLVEITPFPSGSLTENDYNKAEKLERVLRSGPSV